jgi:hypothetical protein
MWVRSGKWPEIQAFLYDCASKLVTQKELCGRLNIDEATFSRLKARHPEIQKTMDDAQIKLKMDLMGTMYKKAVGFDVTEEDQIIEEGSHGVKKRKITKYTKHVPPDFKALNYLLTHHFGREFSDRAEELRLAEAKMKDNTEEWNANGNEESEDSD